MRTTLRIITFILLIFSFSCEEQGLFVQCSDCVADEPLQVEITAKLDRDLFYGCQVQIWEGNLEDSILFVDYTAYQDTFTYSVTINKTYTLTATYLVGDNKYIAVDSATPRDRYEKSQCDNPCYFIYDTKYDLRLKYTR